MIAYSRKAIKGLAFLFKQFNDIDVYVEDTTASQMYEILINRILEGRAKVTKIYQLGGKPEVLQACHENAANPKGRAEIYIIDGDFDRFLSFHPRLEFPDNLYQLNVYCSENLVITEEAVLHLIYENVINTQLALLKADLDFMVFITHLWERLRELYAYYIVANLLEAGIPTTAAQVLTFRDLASRWMLSEEFVRNRREEIERELIAEHSDALIKYLVETISNKFPNSPEQGIKILSGKTALLPVLKLFMHDFCLARGGRVRDDLRSIVIRLARNCSLEVDPEFRIAIQKAAGF